MKWLLTVNTLDYEIDKAYKISKFFEIPQEDKFSLGDEVYIIVHNDRKDAHVKYKSKVVGVNIDIEDEEYFEEYQIPSSEIRLINFLVRLEFVDKRKAADIDLHKLEKIGLNKLPIIPIKGIGENASVLEDVERLFYSEQDDIHTNLHFIDFNDSHDLNTLDCEHKREEFIKHFAQNKWDEVSFDDFFEHRHLLINKVNENEYVLSEECFIEFDPNRNEYLSNGSVINDTQSFFKAFKTELIALLEGDAVEEIIFERNYPLTFLTIFAYYMNSTFIPMRRIDAVSEFFKFDMDQVYNFNLKIAKHLRKSFPSLSEKSGSILTRLVMDQISTKPVNQSTIDQETYEPIIDQALFDRLIKLLKKKKKLIIRNLRYVDGVEFVKNLAKRISGKHVYSVRELGQYERSIKALPYINYCFYGDFGNLTSLKTVLDKVDSKLENNVHIILFDYVNEVGEVSDTKLNVLFDEFYEVVLAPHFNQGVESKLVSYGNSIEDVQYLLARVKEINMLLNRQPGISSFISPNMLLAERIVLKEDMHDFIEFKLSRYIERLYLDQQIYTLVTKEIESLYQYFS